jgi:DNA-binding NarL/FixJ family response regulator
MPVRLLIVDGHPVTRCGLAHSADEQADLRTVGETGSAVEALELVAALTPDVVTIDVALPDGSGLDLARELRHRNGALGIVILAAEGNDEMLFRALETGASAFVAKVSPVREILAAVRHAAAAASSFSAVGLAQALLRRETVTELVVLSPREREVLAFLQAGLSVPAIAAVLFVSLSTAKTHVARLYAKLGAVNRAQALMAAIRLGLIEQPRSLSN